MSKTKGLAAREPQTITAKVDDGFYAEVRYTPRQVFKWHITVYRTVMERDWLFDYAKGGSSERMVTRHRQLDTGAAETRLGAVVKAKRLLRRERKWAEMPPASEKDFIVR